MTPASAMVTREGYNKVFETVVNDLVGDKVFTREIPIVLRRLEKILRYNVPQDMDVRGYMVASAYGELTGGTATPADIHLAYLLGWAWQILMAYHTILDDFLDDDESRWGKPTWYCLNGKRSIVMNDAILLEHAAFRLLRKYFGEMPIYGDLLDHFSTTNYEYSLGQSLEDQTLINGNASDTSGVSMRRYRVRVKYVNQSGFFSQFQLAMILAQVPKTDNLWHRMEAICSDLAYFFAVRDDLHDSFGRDRMNPVNDKDIRLGLCKWMVTMAKEVCSPSQWENLKTAYGKDDNAKVTFVKEMYKELGIPQLCEEHLKGVKNKLNRSIDTLVSDGHGVGNVVKEMLEFYANTEEY